MYNSRVSRPMNGEMTRGDALPFMQSPVTTQVDMSPVLPFPENVSIPHYPKGSNNTSNASGIYQGNLAMIAVGEEHQMTATGVGSSQAIHSFGNRPKPVRAEYDEFCEGWRHFGVVKNNYTNPEDGGSFATGGITRINSLSAAIQIAGSRHLAVHCRNTIHTGDLLIWMPPDPEREYTEENEFGNPIPEIAPLHWTSWSEQHSRKLQHIMLEYQAMVTEVVPALNLDPNQQYSHYAQKRWYQAALAMKADKLTIGTAMMVVAEKKGHIRINTPERTWRDAHLQRYAHKCILAKRDLDKTVINETKFRDQMKDYITDLTSEIKSGMEQHPSHQGSSDPDNIIWVHDKTKNEVVAYQLGTRTCVDHLFHLYAEVLKTSAEQMVKDVMVSDDAIAQQIRRMGLGERGIIDELKVDTSEMLALCSYDSLDTRSTADFWKPLEKNFAGGSMRSSISHTFQSFESHLRNGTNRTATHQMERRYAMANRVVAKAFTPASGTPEANFTKRPGPFDQKIVDVVLGFSFV